MKVTYIPCPLCGLSRVLEKLGTGALTAGGPEAKAKLQAHGPKGRIRFDHMDPEASAFVQVRETEGGRGSGFHTVETRTLGEVLSTGEVADLVEQLRAQVKRLHEFLEAHG